MGNSDSKTALITGVTGQDGSYLAEFLLGNPQPTQHPRIMKAHEELLPWPQLRENLDALSLAMRVNDVPLIRGLLKQLVSGYTPSEEVVDWVHLQRHNNLA